MVKKILAICFVLVLLINPIATFAAEDRSITKPSEKQEFSTTYDVTYDIDNEGVTTVTERIVLKNLTSQYYATEFKLTIGATALTDIKATDSSGSMETKVEKIDTGSVITVKFNQQVAGLEKQFPWTLQFRSKDFAQKQGKVWEVSVPKVSSSTTLESYGLTLSVPSNFGEPTLISPTPKSQTSSNNKRFLTFDKNQLVSAGVSATFGNNQIYDFDLSYHLENTGLVPVLTYIALPPDTPYQDVVYQRIDPKPLNVTVDPDGNYLAWYRLERNHKSTVNVIGSAKLYSSSKVKNATLDPKLWEKYTDGTKYWEKDTPSIKLKANEILGSNPPVGTREKALLIHRYVVNYLKYDPSRLSSDIERFGSVAALNNPSQSVCMEFTDLFIALARAAGIPARELNGFAYTANSKLRPLSLNKDILHAWPEYWDDQKGWVMIDPTWENTTGGVDYFNKFDLNHFVFVIKGSSSQQPVPAGSYKFAGEDSRDVKVVLSDVDFLGKPQINVTIDSSSSIEAGLPGKIGVKVNNQGNAVQQSTALGISSKNLNILSNTNKALGLIPAFGFAEFEYNFRTKSFFDSFEDEIKITIGKDTFSKNITVRPFVLFRMFPLIVGAVIVLIVSVYGLVFGVFFYRKRVAKKALFIEEEDSKQKKPLKKATR